LLLNSVLLRFLFFHSGRLGRVSAEDVEDIAAQKSLDLLRRAELGQWSLAGRSPAEITGFLTKVARNGLLDHLRKTSRQVQPDEEERPDWDAGHGGWQDDAATEAQPQLRVERREFAEALRVCAEALNPRSRLIWFFRVFLEMPSKKIAAHPEVELKASHVDVLLQRAREAVRECMDRKGFQPRDIPPGVFVELWRAFRVELDG